LIVGLAPNINDWEIYPAKPKKKWHRKMEIDIESHSSCIDFTGWKYKLTAFGDRSFFDITFLPEIIDGLDPKRYRGMGILYAESELGEELFLERIGSVDVELIQQNLNGETPAAYLYDHIQSLIGRKDIRPNRPTS